MGTVRTLGKPDPLEARRAAWKTETEAIVSTEAAFVGTVLAHPDSFPRVAWIEPSHFGDDYLGALWAIIREQAAGGRRVSATEIISTLGSEERLAVSRLLGSAMPPSLLPQYAEHIVSSACVRRFHEAMLQFPTDGYFEPTERLREMFAEVDDIRAMSRRVGRSVATSEEIGKRLLDEIELRKEGKGLAPSTGCSDLDKLLPGGGLMAQSLIVMAGRTGMGKTAVLTSISAQVAEHRRGVAIFSLEVPATEIMARIVSRHLRSGPTYNNILSGNVSEFERHDVEQAMRLIAGWPLLIDDTPGLTVTDIEARVASCTYEWRARGLKPGLIVVDHMQIVRPADRYKGNRVAELGEIANQMKIIAKTYGVCVIVASQINRSVEAREDKRPTMADIRQSGEIEEAADAIALLYRPSYYLDKVTGKEHDADFQAQVRAAENRIEVILDKSRQGRTGRVELFLDPSRSSLANFVMM